MSQISNDFDSEAKRVEKQFENTDFKPMNSLEIEVATKCIGKLKIMIQALQGRYIDTCSSITRITALQNNTSDFKQNKDVDFDDPSITNNKDLK